MAFKLQSFSQREMAGLAAFFLSVDSDWSPNHIWFFCPSANNDRRKQKSVEPSYFTTVTIFFFFFYRIQRRLHVCMWLPLSFARLLNWATRFSLQGLDCSKSHYFPSRLNRVLFIMRSASATPCSGVEIPAVKIMIWNRTRTWAVV